MRETATVTARLLARLGAGCLLLAATASSAAETIQIDGSSTVYPVAEAVAEEFQTARKGAVRVTVGISGTGGGFKKFCRGETDLSNASRPILAEEMAACRQAGVSYIEIPVAYDALTVAVSPKNDSLTCIALADLKKAFEPDAQGKVTRWNQVRPEWPDMELHLYGAGSDSGTFDYFTEAVVGKAKASRGDYTASEDDNVLVQGIENDKSALGYIPFAYYAPHAARLKALAIDGGHGCVMPSLENVTKGTYTPLARPLFIYVSAKSVERPAVRDFVKFFLTEGPALVAEVKYLPLPAAAYGQGLARFEKGQKGTAFGGKPEVGLPVEEILKRTPVE
jgi:phosphate transport system substrate-binding protein